MSCPKCAELEQQVSYLENEVEYWNSLYKRERDKNLAGTFEELSGLSAKNKSLTESVAEYKKLYYDTRTRAELIRTSLTERVVAAEAVIKVARTVRPGIYPERTGVDALRDALKVYDASQTRQDQQVTAGVDSQPQAGNGVASEVTPGPSYSPTAQDYYVSKEWTGVKQPNPIAKILDDALSTQDNTTTKCFKCGQTGHLTWDCKQEGYSRG